MIDLKAPPAKGYSRRRGRPKVDGFNNGPTSAMLTKRKSLREKLGLKEINKPLSWLEICYNQKLISKALFETGKIYAKIRIQAIHSQGIARFKSSSYLLIRHELKNPSFKTLAQRESAEKLWNKFAQHLPAATIRDLDALLLQPLNDDLSAAHYDLCKIRLQTVLTEVYCCFNKKLA